MDTKRSADWAALLGQRAVAYLLARRLTGGDAAAEDAVQEAYLKALAALAAGPLSGEPRVWFLRVVANAAKDQLRGEARRRGREEAVAAGSALRDDRAHAAAESAELRAALRQEMRGLDARLRAPLSLHYEAGLTLDEVAAVLDLPAGTVRAQVSRGLDELRERLKTLGFAAAAPLVVAGLAAGPLESIPAALAAKLAAMTTTSGAASAAAPTAAAVKGGVAMKIILGVVAAGAVAGVVGFIGRMGPIGPMNSPPAPAAIAEHPDNPTFKFEPLVAARNPHRGSMYCWRYGYAGVLDGPGLESEICDSDDISCDDAGNCFWTEPGHFNFVRGWRPADGRVRTLAGSAAGDFDGPLERARFSGWGGGGYAPSLTAASRDGKHVFLRDPKAGNSIRHVDFEAGMVSTVGRNLVLAKDASGDVYVLDPKGGNVPAGKGYKTFVVPKLEQEGLTWGAWRILDVAKGRLYGEERGPAYYWDLKTGKIAYLTAKDKGRPWKESGPLETTSFWCPIGLSISPGGRFLYMGGGDAYTLHRLDLEKNEARNLGRNADGTCVFKTGSESGGFADWPGGIAFAADGTGYWGSPAGIFRLTLVK